MEDVDDRIADGDDMEFSGHGAGFPSWGRNCVTRKGRAGAFSTQARSRQGGVLASGSNAHHTAAMTALTTPRLRLEFVTPELARIAGQGRAALEAALGARIGEDWSGGYVFQRSRRVALDDHPIHAVIILKAEALVVGELRFEPLDDGVFEIGYAVATPYRRRGIAVEATARLLAFLQDEAAAARIVAGCGMANIASVRTLRRLGFELDGSSARARAFWWIWAPERAPRQET
jgi:RimJ/RimL family protein N-acetyltransferase